MHVVLNGKGLETSKKTAEELLEEQGINPETVVVKLNGRIVPDNEELHEGDIIELIGAESRG